MQSNRIAQLSVVLAALLGVAFFAGVFDSEPSTISVPEVSVPTDQVSGIRLQTDAWEAALSQIGGVWQLTEPVASRADSNTVTRLLDSLEELELNSVVSTNPERHSRYGVDQGSGRYLTVTHGSQESQFVIAEQGPDFSTSYVRLDESEAVYAASRIALPSTLDQLRDKTLLNLLPGTIRSVSVATSEQAYDLTYGDGWTITEQGGSEVAADSIKVTSWLRRYAPLRFDGFEDTLTPDSVDVTITVRLAQADGQSSTVYMGTRGDDLVAYTDKSPQVMRAAGTRLGFLIEEAEGLRAP